MELEKKRFSGIKMVVLAAIYGFSAIGGLSAYAAVYGYLPDYVGATMVQISLCASVLSAVAAVLSFVTDKVILKIGPKMCMVTGGVCMMVYGALAASFKSLYVLYVAFGFLGVIMSIGGVTAISDLIVKWFGKKSPTYISFCIGVACVGGGISEGIAGVLLEAFGMRAVFLEFIVFGVIAVISALMLTNAPEDIGQKQYGDGTEEAAAKQGAKTAAAKAAKPKKSIYSNPAVWLFLVAVAMGRFIILPISYYATVYFPEYGMSVTGAGMVIMFFGIASGLFNMIGGKIMEKIGVRAYIYMSLIFSVGIYLFSFLYEKQPIVIVAVMVVICYAIGAVCLNLGPISAPVIFGTEVSTDIISKSVGLTMAGNIMCPIIIAWFLTIGGYSAAWGLAIGATVVALVLYTGMFICMKGRNSNS